MDVFVPDRFDDVLREPEVRAEIVPDDGTYPNNDSLPLLLYRHAVRRSVRAPARTMERLFWAHAWTGAWRDGIFGYHHYHSTAHEVLGIAGGTATVQLGGPDGLTVDVTTGDVLVLPAGVAHKNLGANANFLVVGAYPQGQSWDLKTGAPEDRPEADHNVERVPLPTQDPVYGDRGPLLEHWSV